MNNMEAKMNIKLLPGGNLAGFIGDRWFQATTKNPKYEALVNAIIRNDAEMFVGAYDSCAVNFSAERHEIKDGITIQEDFVEYRGQRITDPTIIKVVRSYSTQCDALKHFIDNLFLNPQWESVQQLGAFLKYNQFPLTEDGCFLGYKAVRDDWTDIHSGRNDNSVGRTVTMPREDVAFDPKMACSAGLHVGTYEYATGFGGSNSRMVIVKVNPAHCVSVPFDHDSQKLRCSQYTVLAECSGTLDTNIVYTMDGQQILAENWFADMRNEELGRRRRPSKPIVSGLTPSDIPAWNPCEDSDGDYDYDEDDDDSCCDDCGCYDCTCDQTEWYCDCCGWSITFSEYDADNSTGFCVSCGNELERQ